MHMNRIEIDGCDVNIIYGTRYTVQCSQVLYVTVLLTPWYTGNTAVIPNIHRQFRQNTEYTPVPDGIQLYY